MASLASNSSCFSTLNSEFDADSEANSVEGPISTSTTPEAGSATGEGPDWVVTGTSATAGNLGPDSLNAI